MPLGDFSWQKDAISTIPGRNITSKRCHWIHLRPPVFVGFTRVHRDPFPFAHRAWRPQRRGGAGTTAGASLGPCVYTIINTLLYNDM